jgi:molybdate transport system permease protein
MAKPLQRALVAFLALFALCFLLLPLLVLVIRAVTAQAWDELPQAAILQAILLSILTTLATVVLTLLFGTPLAYIFARWRFPFRRALNLLVELPIVLPPAVAGLALLVTFGRRGAFGPSLEALGVMLPFTTAAVVARVDGAAGWALFRRVTLPLAQRALAAGIVLSWARALGEFGATILFAGSLQGRTQTMPLLIYNVLERDIDASILSGVILIGMALLALVVSHWLRREDRHEENWG